MLALAALAVGLSVPAGAGTPSLGAAPGGGAGVEDLGAGGDASEAHDPIWIRNDAQLLAPDAVAGNGVRGGTGTASDPVRITNWTIRVEEPGIVGLAIENTDLHVLVRNVRVVAGPDVDPINVTGFAFDEVRNLTVVNVTTARTADRAGIVADSVVSFRGGTWSGVGDERQAPITLSVQNSSIRLEDTTVEGGRTGITIWHSSVMLENVTIREGQHMMAGIVVAPPLGPVANVTTHLTVRNSTLADPDYDWPGIDLQACSVRARIVNTTFTGFGSQVLDGGRDGDCEVPPGIMVARGNTFRDGSTGIELGGTGRRIVLEGNLFRNLNAGIEMTGRARVVNNTFYGNGDGIEYDFERDPDVPAPQTVRGNAFVGNERYAIGGPDRLPLDATGNWWGTPDGPIVGDDPLPFEARERVAVGVQVEPWLAAPPDAVPEAPSMSLADGLAPPQVGWDLQHEIEDALFVVVPGGLLLGGGVLGWRKLRDGGSP